MRQGAGDEHVGLRELAPLNSKTLNHGFALSCCFFLAAFGSKRRKL